MNSPVLLFGIFTVTILLCETMLWRLYRRKAMLLATLCDQKGRPLSPVRLRIFTVVHAVFLLVVSSVSLVLLW